MVQDGKNITEIESLLLLAIAFFFAYNVIFIVGVGYLRCLLFFFLVHGKYMWQGKRMKKKLLRIVTLEMTSWQN